jgi:hypothetical protein
MAQCPKTLNQHFLSSLKRAVRQIMLTKCKLQNVVIHSHSSLAECHTLRLLFYTLSFPFRFMFCLTLSKLCFCRLFFWIKCSKTTVSLLFTVTKLWNITSGLENFCLVKSHHTLLLFSNNILCDGQKTSNTLSVSQTSNNWNENKSYAFATLLFVAFQSCWFFLCLFDSSRLVTFPFTGAYFGPCPN